MANRQFIASREDFSVSCFARRISLYAKIKIPRLAHWWTANRFHWWSEKRFKEFSHEIHAKFWSAIFGRLDIEKTSSEKKIYAIFIFSVYLNYQFNYLDTSRELFLGSDVWQSWNPNRKANQHRWACGYFHIEASFAHIKRTLLYHTQRTIRFVAKEI